MILISFKVFSVDESFKNFLYIFSENVNTHVSLRKCTRKEKKLKVKLCLNKTLLKSIKKKTLCLKICIKISINRFLINIKITASH